MKRFKTIEMAFDSLEEGKTFNHEITWYIDRPLTWEEWIALDDAQGEAFEKVGISLDDVVGIAGPIPFPPEDEKSDD